MNRQAKQLQNKSRTHEIKKIADHRYELTSGTSGKIYSIVILPNSGASCNCEFGTKRHHENGAVGCSHTIAVFDFIAKENGAKSVSAWASEEEAKRQHRQMNVIGDGLVLTKRGV